MLWPGPCKKTFARIANWHRAALKRRPFSLNVEATDYSKLFGEVQPTAKQLLIERCQRNCISVFVDDPSENSADFYAEFRGVASEAELERRLNSKLALSQVKHSNKIALLALVVSLGSFVNSFYV